MLSPEKAGHKKSYQYQFFFIFFRSEELHHLVQYSIIQLYFAAQQSVTLLLLSAEFASLLGTPVAIYPLTCHN